MKEYAWHTQKEIDREKKRLLKLMPHDFKHWLKICKGDKDEATEATLDNSSGFCCFYEDTINETRTLP